MDPAGVSMTTIKDKLIEVGITLNTLPNDEILGDLSIVYTTKNFKNETVKFTYEDAYVFLRSVYRKRKAGADYIRKQKEIAELETFLSENKTQEQKVAEAMKKLSELKEETGN